jgi:hypothetical protein
MIDIRNICTWISAGSCVFGATILFFSLGMELFEERQIAIWLGVSGFSLCAITIITIIISTFYRNWLLQHRMNDATDTAHQIHA